MTPDVPDGVDHRGVKSAMSSLNNILPRAEPAIYKALLVGWR
jgi:hypothetical protein